MTQTEVAKMLAEISSDKYTVYQCKTRDQWLKRRTKTIGASDAAAVLGLSPWMTEAELYALKTGQVVYKESDGNAAITRGQKSEEHIRELYAIEMGEEVMDGTGIILQSVANPFMSCTLDGIIIHREPGNSIAEPIVPSVLEIKSVLRGQDWTNDTVPQHYLVQVMHQMVVTGWNQVVLRARFSSTKEWPTAYERSYVFNRQDYQDQMDKLVAKERKFWFENVISGKRPSVRMPSI